ncbi:MAG: LuxR C-terminal-related transcriptional regulator [Methanococcaceae archaeon]
MNSELYLQRFNNIFSDYKCVVEESDYSQFELNRKLLVKIAEVENSSLAVYDLNKKQYILADSKFDKKTGYRLNHDFHVNPDYFYGLMHPDDFPVVLNTIIRTITYLNSLPPAEKTEYKLILDFRLKNNRGDYLRFVQQVVVLELDRRGNIWLILKLVDLVSEEFSTLPAQRKLMNIKTGKLTLFNDEGEDPTDKVLSKRETEVLGLISQGLNSKNIAERLFISVNTVNNHRQKILAKTRSWNSSHAIIYAKRIGII